MKVFLKIEMHIGNSKFDEEIKQAALTLLRECSKPEGADLCERAFWIHRCWKLSDPKVKTD